MTFHGLAFCGDTPNSQSLYQFLLTFSLEDSASIDFLLSLYSFPGCTFQPSPYSSRAMPPWQPLLPSGASSNKVLSQISSPPPAPASKPSKCTSPFRPPPPSPLSPFSNIPPSNVLTPPSPKTPQSLHHPGRPPPNLHPHPPHPPLLPLHPRPRLPRQHPSPLQRHHTPPLPHQLSLRNPLAHPKKYNLHPRAHRPGCHVPSRARQSPDVPLDHHRPDINHHLLVRSDI